MRKIWTKLVGRVVPQLAELKKSRDYFEMEAEALREELHIVDEMVKLAKEFLHDWFEARFKGSLKWY